MCVRVRVRVRVRARPCFFFVSEADFDALRHLWRAADQPKRDPGLLFVVLGLLLRAIR